MDPNSPITRHIRLAGHLTLREGMAAAQDFLDALIAGDIVVVDTRAVEFADVCHLQMMVAAHRFANRLNKVLVVKVPVGGAVEDGLKRNGMVDAADATLTMDGENWIGVADRLDAAA